MSALYITHNTIIILESITFTVLLSGHRPYGTLGSGPHFALQVTLALQLTPRATSQHHTKPQGVNCARDERASECRPSVTLLSLAYAFPGELTNNVSQTVTYLVLAHVAK